MFPVFLFNSGKVLTGVWWEEEGEAPVFWLPVNRP